MDNQKYLNHELLDRSATILHIASSLVAEHQSVKSLSLEEDAQDLIDSIYAFYNKVMCKIEDLEDDQT